MPKNLYGWFRKIANENNDEDVNGFLDLYDKYMLGENSFLNNDNLSDEMVDGFYDAILYNITNSSSPKEAQENIFKFFNENFDPESEEYIAFNDFEKQWNEKKQAKEEAEEAIKTQEESKEGEEDNTDYFGEFAHKDFDQDKFDQMFSNDQQDPNPILDFLSKPENEGLSVAIAEMLGYDPDDINVTIVDYLKNVDYNSLLDSMQQQFNVAKQNASNEGSEENPGNTPDDEGAGPAENGQEDESGDENATPAESEGDITPDDANKGTDDGVSNAQKAGNGFVSQNDKPLEKKPKGIRGAAEASIDQKYENQEGVDVQIEGQDKSDTWHVNRYSAKYHIESLVDRASRFLKQMVPSLSKVTAQVLTKELNRRFKMQEFIDSGFLRKVLESGNEQIRFVMLNDDSLVENRNKYKDFKVQAMFGQSIFAAIQIPDSLRDEYDKAGYTLIDFKAADGSVVPMQILGVISPNDISTKSNGQYVDPEFAKFAHSSA